ncbi:MAG: rhodanese-like domain-containing protein [Bacteroidales bacterium]|nr:rhodanese-like domain-containing protein [Bacteroidales bacterium]MDD4576383.1 rhodanese-like domain-containing protein [Bacteroidales bacterium]
MEAYSVVEAYRLCKEEKCVILDVRTRSEFAEKYPDVPTVYPIFEKELKERWITLPVNVKILIFDTDGEKANRIAIFLNGLEFDVDFIVGGMKEWELKELPVLSLDEKCLQNSTCKCSCGRND